MAPLHNLLLEHKRTFVALAVAGLLGMMALTAILSMKNDSATLDEIAHVAAGYSYLTTQEYRLNPEHPPLVKDLAAFPLLFLNLNAPYHDASWTRAVNGQWTFGQLLFYKSGNDPDQILFWARLPMVMLLVALGLFLFYWAKKLGGLYIGFGALLLFVFSPTFLAHGRLVTTDVGATLGVVAATYFYLLFLYKPFFKYAVLAAIFLSAALLLKFSTFILIPYFVFLTVLYRAVFPGDVPKPAFLRYGFYGACISVLTLLFVSLFYWPHVVNYETARQIRDAEGMLAWFYRIESDNVSFKFAEISFLKPLSQYVAGLLLIFARVAHDSPRYFLGELRFGSEIWHYYPVLYLTKIPLAFHMLSFLAMSPFLSLVRRTLRGFNGETVKFWLFQHFTAVAMALFVFFYASIAMQSPLTIGVRHILPIVPFLYILVMLGLQKWIKDVRFPSHPIKVTLVALLLGWYIGSSFAAFPHYLSYYNELAGGIKQGYKVAVDSNYDWGQDLKRLARWVEEQGVQKIYVDYFGGSGIDPAYYLRGAYIPWRGASWWDGYPETQKDRPEDFPRGNYLAVSATFLQSGTVNKRDYLWLDEYEPVARPGPSIFVYYIDK